MSSFQQVILKNEKTILSSWLGEMAAATRRCDLMGDAELKQQAAELLRLFAEASQTSSDVQSDAFVPVRTAFLTLDIQTALVGFYAKEDFPSNQVCPA